MRRSVLSNKGGIVFAFFSLFMLQLSAQDLPFEGMWKGLLSQKDKSLMYEVIFKLYYETDSTLFGTTKMVSRSGDYVEYYVEGTFTGNELQFNDITLMKESGSSEKNPWCLKNYTASVQLVNDNWVMKGNWSNPAGAYVQGEFIEDSSVCQPGKFSLKKIKGYANQTEKEGDKIRYFQGRLVEIQEEFEVDEDTIYLNIIDNNQEDNDTVTVFYNKQLLLKQHRLSHESKVVQIVVKDKPRLMVIYANNIGDIPPNTAALYFFENGVKREVAIHSDTQKNAGVIFKRKVEGE